MGLPRPGEMAEWELGELGEGEGGYGTNHPHLDKGPASVNKRQGLSSKFKAAHKGHNDNLGFKGQ